MKKMLCLFMVAVFSCCVMTVTRADVWNYSVDAKIVNYELSGAHKTWNDGGLRQSYDSLSADQTVLSWGEKNYNTGAIYNNRTSSITLQGQSGQYNVGTGDETAALLIHKNSTISTNVPTPTFVDMQLDFLFTQTNKKQKVQVDLHMGFWETPNDGSQGFEDDIFYFLSPFSTFRKIQLDDTSYYLSFFNTYEKLDKDSDYYEYAADRLAQIDRYFTYGDDIWGWITKENSTNTFEIGFQINENLPPRPNVPEPATMLIFGLAAAGGLPVALRRRMFKK